MAYLIGLASLVSLAGRVYAQQQGGFPDCQNGPLSNNTVCDRSAGTYR